MHACTKGSDANRRERQFTRKQSERNFVGEEKSKSHTDTLTEKSGVAWSTNAYTSHTCDVCQSLEFADPFRGVTVPDGSWCGALSWFPSRRCKAISPIRILLPHNESLSINTSIIDSTEIFWATSHYFNCQNWSNCPDYKVKICLCAVKGKSIMINFFVFRAHQYYSAENI